MIARIAPGLALVAALAAPAAADRDPWLPGTPAASFASPGGAVRVHYVTTTVDAVLATDADASGVPDFVEEVGRRGDEVFAAYAARGFRAPLADGVLGGDARLDIYLKNLAGADGSFVADTCSERPFTCAGHVTIENDFVGYSYPSVSIAIRVLVSHELFHAVQAAYDADQPVAWSEGSAVWAEEAVYPEQDDFEHLVAAFLAKPFRPFDRAGAGFGDLYPYGAGLWPHFLELAVGAGVVRDVWERCQEQPGTDPPFLDAVDAALVARGRTLATTWIEFTRWNARTNVRAVGSPTYPDAQRLALALREAPLAAPGTKTVSIEGLSARYLPLTGVTGTMRVELTAARGVGAAVIATPGTLEIIRVSGAETDLDVRHVIELRAGAATVDAELVVTGARRGGLPDDVTVTLAPYVAPPMPPTDDDDGGCCAAGRTPGRADLLLVGLLGILLSRRRRRRTRAPARA